MVRGKLWKLCFVVKFISRANGNQRPRTKRKSSHVNSSFGHCLNSVCNVGGNCNTFDFAFKTNFKCIKFTDSRCWFVNFVKNTEVSQVKNLNLFIKISFKIKPVLTLDSLLQNFTNRNKRLDRHWRLMFAT